MAARRGSLFWTLSAAIFAVLLLAVLLQAVVVVAVIEPYNQHRARERAERVAQEASARIASLLEIPLPGGLPSELTRIESLAAPLLVFYRTPEGRIVSSARRPPGWRRRHAMLEGRRLPWPDAPEGSEGRPPTGMRRGARPPVTPLEILARAPVLVEGQERGEVVVAWPRRRLSVLGALPRRAFVYLPIALLLAVLAGLGVSRRLQRRLQALEVHATRVGAGDLSARLPAGDDEIGRVAARLNAMSERLEAARAELQASEDERRRLLADITHELATPLTSIRGFAETLLDPDIAIAEADRRRYLEEVLRAAQRMDLLVGDLLDLARLEAGGSPLRFEPLDAVELVRHRTEAYRPRFEEAGLSLELEEDLGGASGQIEADGLRIEQVIDNLLENELRHVPAGGRIRVQVEDAGDALRLRVLDDGPGFDPKDLPHVFERFYRADRSRSEPGSGLGLAIVREIVRRHGGWVEARNRPSTGDRPGGGELVLEVPRRASAA